MTLFKSLTVNKEITTLVTIFKALLYSWNGEKQDKEQKLKHDFKKTLFCIHRKCELVL